MSSPSFDLREFFHLVFLRHLAGRFAGRGYAVKGGICLRFFHRSQRLSEDMDLDVSPQVAAGTLRKAVDAILEARSLRSALASRGIVEVEISRPKQTGTVQRWKAGLIVGGTRLPTKIEFSRRREKIDFQTGIPNREILNAHGQFGFAAQFYGAESMAVQKITALAAPGRIAARDLFDLHHVMVFLKADRQQVAEGLKTISLDAAVDKIETFTREDFSEQVVPYLAADLMSLYSNRAAFENLKSETRSALKEFIP